MDVSQIGKRVWGERAIGYDYVYFQLIGRGNVMRHA